MKMQTTFSTLKHGLTIYAMISFSIIFLLCSCNDDDSSMNTGVQGEWVWVKSVGGIAGWTLTPESEMMSKSLVIDDFNYEEYQDGSLAFRTTYNLEIRQDSSWGSDQFLIFDSGAEYVAKIEGSELQITEISWSDGYVHFYERN